MQYVDKKVLCFMFGKACWTGTLIVGGLMVTCTRFYQMNFKTAVVWYWYDFSQLKTTYGSDSSSETIKNTRIKTSRNIWCQHICLQHKRTTLDQWQNIVTFLWTICLILIVIIIIVSIIFLFGEQTTYITTVRKKWMYVFMLLSIGIDWFFLWK